MSETPEERLARLTALIADGWCPCRSSAGDAGWLVDQLAAAIEKLDEAQARDMCDSCAGTGEPTSGRPCMCGGTGRMSDAASYLREQMVRVEFENARLRAALVAVVGDGGVDGGEHYECRGEECERARAVIAGALSDGRPRAVEPTEADVEAMARWAFAGTPYEAELSDVDRRIVMRLAIAAIRARVGLPDPAPVAPGSPPRRS